MMEQSGKGNGVRIVDRRGRRWYTSAFRAEVIEQCQQPGTSVAAIALERGLNANLVRKWIAKRAMRPDLASLVPVKLRPVDTPPRSPAGRSACAVVIRRSDIEVTISESARAEQIEAVIRALR